MRSAFPRGNTYAYPYSYSNCCVHTHCYSDCCVYTYCYSNCCVHTHCYSNCCVHTHCYSNCCVHTYCDRDCNGNFDGKRDTDCDSHGNCDGHANCDSDANCHSHRFRQSDTDTQTNPHSKTPYDTEAAPESAAKAGRSPSRLGSACVSRAGDSESFRESRTFLFTRAGSVISSRTRDASRRNELPRRFMAGLIEYVRKVRDGEDAIASTRDARAPRNGRGAKTLTQCALLAKKALECV